MARTIKVPDDDGNGFHYAKEITRKEAANRRATNTQVKKTLKNGNPINVSAQFGQPNGNKQGHGFWKREDTPRWKLEQMMKMPDEDLRKIVEDKTASRFEQVLATAIHKGDIKVAFEMIDQVYGRPMQKFEGEVEMPTPLVDLTKRRKK